jgi:hypothetical protein
VDGKGTSRSAHAMNTDASIPMDRWNTLPWKSIQRKVFKLQTRIYRAACPGTHDTRHVVEEPGEGKLCAAGRGAASLTQSRGVRRETPGSSTHLTAKARGDKSLSEKRESREGVYRGVLRDPCDKVRAGLPKPCATSPRAGFSSQRREVRKNRPPGHLTYRMAKALRDHSLLGTREMS